MAIDLNMNIGDLFKKKKDATSTGNNKNNISNKPSNNGNNFKAKYYTNIAIFFVVFSALIGSFVYFVYLPLMENNKAKEAAINDLKLKQSELTTINKDIVRIREEIAQTQSVYLENLSNFSSSEDLSDLYQSVSTIASKYNLMVLNIKEDEKKKEDDKKSAATIKSGKKNVNVNEINVTVELKGHYVNYLKFKEELAVSEMLLNINNETLKVDTNTNSSTRGMITTNINFSSYAIDKAPFEALFEENEKFLTLEGLKHKKQENINSINNIIN